MCSELGAAFMVPTSAVVQLLPEWLQTFTIVVHEWQWQARGCCCSDHVLELQAPSRETLKPETLSPRILKP